MWLLPFLLLHACDPVVDDTAPPGPWTGWSPPSGPWSYEGPPRVLVAEADEAMDAGAVGVLDPESETWVHEGDPIHADAVGACAGPFLLVVNRFLADNLQFLDATSGTTLAQWSTGNGTNPTAVVFLGEEAWVSLYEQPTLLVARWDTGAEIARVDLGPWADADGVPEVSDLFFLDGLLWATLQRMDRDGEWQPAGGSRLLGVDPDRREVVQEIVLPLDNPNGGWRLRGTLLEGAAVGAWSDASGTTLALDGGLLSVDPKAGTAEVLLSEEAIGRNLVAALPAGERTWLSTYDASWTNHLEIWDGPPWSLGTEVLSGFYAGWDQAGDGSVWVADHTAARVRRLDGASGLERGGADTVLRPTDVAVCGF